MARGPLPSSASASSSRNISSSSGSGEPDLLIVEHHSWMQREWTLTKVSRRVRRRDATALCCNRPAPVPIAVGTVVVGSRNVAAKRVQTVAVYQFSWGHRGTLKRWPPHARLQQVAPVLRQATWRTPHRLDFVRQRWRADPEPRASVARLVRGCVVSLGRIRIQYRSGFIDGRNDRRWPEPASPRALSRPTGSTRRKPTGTSRPLCHSVRPSADGINGCRNGWL